jgi:glyoxylase-like metal-dependent hydrolase (beta-lactamase superfamily II)
VELIKIKGNSYYINGPTNIGVYVFKNKNCLLVDTGKNNSDAHKIEEVLIENNLHPKFIINTHNHLDHCGGNLYFQNNYPGCLVYSSLKEKLFMENEELHASILCSSAPIKGIDKSNKPFKVDYILDYGTNKINDEKYEVIPLGGHSIEQIGFMTPEKVCFIGDSVFSSDIIEKYSLPYYYNVSQAINSLEKLKLLEADYFVLSHDSNVIEKSKLIELVQANLSNINEFIVQFLEILEEPQTREDVLENLTVLNELKLNFNQYYLNFAAVSAFIQYLYFKGLIECSIEDGKLYFYSKALS